MQSGIAEVLLHEATVVLAYKMMANQAGKNQVEFRFFKSFFRIILMLSQTQFVGSTQRIHTIPNAIAISTNYLILISELVDHFSLPTSINSNIIHIQLYLHQKDDYLFLVLRPYFHFQPSLVLLMNLVFCNFSILVLSWDP